MKTNRWLLVLLSFALTSGLAFAQNSGPMPEYRPHQQVSGTVRIAGDYHQRAMLRNWEEAFHKYQPNIVFHDNLTSTVHGIPALVFNVADIGLLGREIAPLENLSFRRMFKYDPTEIAIATGSYATPYQAFALGIFVNRANPLSRLTFAQAADIFGCGTGHDIRTWDQLGLTGEWAGKPIHVLGYPSDNNIATFFEFKVLKGLSAAGPTLPSGAKWNCDMKEYENTYDANDKPVISSDTFMFRDLGKDPYAMAYSGIAELTPQVKPLALAAHDDGPYVPLTPATVADRSYPLTRTMYAYVNKAPGKPLNPALNEFLRFILSRQGQAAVLQQKIFLPLTPAAVQESLKKIAIGTAA